MTNYRILCVYQTKHNDLYFAHDFIFATLYVHSTLGWFKMHEVFRYWLPGHFWEGLYVK